MQTLLVVGAIIIAPAIATMAPPVWAAEQHDFQLQLQSPSSERANLGNYQLTPPRYPYDLNIHQYHSEPGRDPFIATPPPSSYEQFQNLKDPFNRHFGIMDDPLPSSHAPPFPGPRGVTIKGNW
jgi:hypothetical protein